MKLVTPDLKILKYAFAAICCISVVTCLTRFDYNLPLFAILYWKFDSIPFDRRWRQLRYIMALIILSIFQDLWYILYWYPKIFSDDWTRYTTPLTQLSSVTMGLASITLIIKVCLISGLFFPNCIHMLCPHNEEDVYEEYEVIKYHKLPPSKA
eukprot:Blabericola_migrator_1__2604@NODE_1735_length_3901_cov_57_627021_g1121_i0_p2_GENE_NODE_1735_length_3901_cov_57_627021_g1121_i0NODE_1735_length_3901_cov_57_627021_g1121_i0_p2_ORF_typecomplete_len153_score11_13AGTRAP/PF06396_11/0_42_NODE_1735_length_3901_cov_57_627021_g1121_i034303888